MLLPAPPGGAASFPRVTTTEYYEVMGRTAQQLRDEMARKGPHGYWAYTTWWVHWSATCKVTLDVTITMPRWADQSFANEALRKSWAAMIAR